MHSQDKQFQFFLFNNCCSSRTKSWLVHCWLVASIRCNLVEAWWVLETSDRRCSLVAVSYSVGIVSSKSGLIGRSAKARNIIIVAWFKIGSRWGCRTKRRNLAGSWLSQARCRSNLIISFGSERLDWCPSLWSSYVRELGLSNCGLLIRLFERAVTGEHWLTLNFFNWTSIVQSVSRSLRNGFCVVCARAIGS